MIVRQILAAAVAGLAASVVLGFAIPRAIFWALERFYVKEEGW